MLCMRWLYSLYEKDHNQDIELSRLMLCVLGVSYCQCQSQTQLQTQNLVMVPQTLASSLKPQVHAQDTTIPRLLIGTSHRSLSTFLLDFNLM